MKTKCGNCLSAWGIIKIIIETGLQKQILCFIIKLKKIIKGDANYVKSKVTS